MDIPLELTKSDPLDLNRSALIAREVDRLEELATLQGKAFFQISSTGHETVASLNYLFATEVESPTDDMVRYQTSKIYDSRFTSEVCDQFRMLV